MNNNTRFDSIKRDDGTTTIRLRFSRYTPHGGYDGDIMLPIDVKPVTPTAAEVKKYGGTKEFCRCDITKWEVVGAPKISLKYVDHLVGKTIWTYFNGYERAWKFQDPDGDIDVENTGLNRISGKFTDTFIDRLDVYLEDHADDFYAPHNDELRIYGNPNAHAVYDMKATQAKACATSKKKPASVKKNCTSSVVVTPKKLECCNVISACFYYASLIEARHSHTKIPFADFGKALRMIVNREMDDVKLGKSMAKMIDCYCSAYSACKQAESSKAK